MVVSMKPNALAKLTKPFVIGPIPSQSPVHISLPLVPDAHLLTCSSLSVQPAPHLYGLSMLALQWFSYFAYSYRSSRLNLNTSSSKSPPRTIPNIHTHQLRLSISMTTVPHNTSHIVIFLLHFHYQMSALKASTETCTVFFPRACSVFGILLILTSYEKLKRSTQKESSLDFLPR